MPSLMKFDQVNRLITELETKLKNNEYTDAFGIRRYKLKKEDVCDSLLDILIMAYVFGNESANTDLNTSVEVNIDKMQTSLYQKIDGKDWQTRVTDYLNNGGSTEDIIRVAKTESHRNYNSGGYDTALDVEDGTDDYDTDQAVNGRQPAKVYKTWQCMMLPQSRDTHIYLNGTKVGINDKFYTFMGNDTLYPGQFGVPEEDINCMCKLKFSRESA